MKLEDYDNALDDFDDVYDMLETIEAGGKHKLNAANVTYIENTMKKER